MTPDEFFDGKILLTVVDFESRSVCFKTYAKHRYTHHGISCFRIFTRGDYRFCSCESYSIWGEAEWHHLFQSVVQYCPQIIENLLDTDKRILFLTEG